MTNEELLEKAVEWFTDIEEMCAKLTSGNVSHLGATIRGKAIRAAEFIRKHKESNMEEKGPIYLAEGVEYYPETDDVLLMRCPKCGKENYALSVADGICCWCGFNGRSLLKQ